MYMKAMMDIIFSFIHVTSVLSFPLLCLLFSVCVIIFHSKI